MGLIDRVSTPARRSALLLTMAVLAVSACLAVWLVGDEPWGAIILAVISGVILVVVKSLLEVAVALRSRSTIVSEMAIRGQLERVADSVVELGSIAGASKTEIDAISDRVLEVESFERRQGGFNDAVVDRVRSVESFERRQGGFNDAVVDRVRSVESFERRQGGFNDAVLSRVQSVEKVAQGHGKFSEMAGDRLDALGAISETITGQSFHNIRRSISADELVEIRDTAEEELGLSVSESQIRYIERVTLGMELVGTGRIAAHTADVAIRVLASLSRGDQIVHAEIGVLSGLYSALLARLSEEMGIETHQVLIDPFEGYYGESDLDVLTLSRIAVDNMHRNMKLAGCDGTEYSLIQGFSGDPLTVEEASARRYDTILVDGDHSYEGVTVDLVSYGPLLKTDGLFLLDDYGNPAWPGVTKAVDEQVAQGSLEILAKISKTAVARYIGNKR